MKRMYWRPVRVSQWVFLLIALLAVVSLVLIERLRPTRVKSRLEEKLTAAQQMQRGIEVIRRYRTVHGPPIDAEADPAATGLIGLASSPTTTNTGSLDAKRTTINPNWAAVVVDLLHQAGVQRGDVVALGVSGSFPALNLAAIAGIEALGLEAVSIVSAGASSFGANIPELTWLDMEKILRDAEVVATSSVAASLGGTRDRAIGLPRSGRRRLENAIERHKLRFIETESDIDSIERRMEIYREVAGGRPIAAYVNAGGSLVSIGPKSIKYVYRPGLNTRLPTRAIYVDSVMKRFLAQGIPVINLSKIVPLAEEYGMPIDPVTLAKVGEGLAFRTQQYSRPLAGALLAVILVSLYGLLKLELGTRITALTGRGRRAAIEPMA